MLARLLDKNLRDRPAASQDLPGRGNEGGKDQFRTARHVAVDLSTSSTQTPSSSLNTEAANPGAAGRMPNLDNSYENNSHLVDWKGIFRTGIIPSWRSEARSRSLFAFRKSRIDVDGIGMIACFLGVDPSIRQRSEFGTGKGLLINRATSQDRSHNLWCRVRRIVRGGERFERSLSFEA